MSYGAFGAIKNTYGTGAIGGVQRRESVVLESVGNILAFPFKDDILDKSGNHTIDDGTASLITVDPSSNAAFTYDGLSMLRCEDGVGFAPRIIASTQAHQIPLSEPVSFGFFCYRRTTSGTPQFMCSGPGNSSCNYGIQRQSSVGWRAIGGGGVTAMGDYRDQTGDGRWHHIAVVHQGTRGSSHAAAFYINGKEAWTGNLTCSAPASTDDFGFVDQSNATDSAFDGFACNFFVSDTVLDAQTIKALSDESFGHASPFSF